MLTEFNQYNFEQRRGERMKHVNITSQIQNSVIKDEILKYIDYRYDQT